MTPEATQVSAGGCQCGAIRYELTAEPLAMYVCHCRECQRQSASAFGISVIMASDRVRVVGGTPGKWSRTADSGALVKCFFCQACGSRAWHGDPDTEKTVSIKGGSLDEPLDIASAVHIWTVRKLSGVVIPEGAQAFDTEPE